MSSIANPQPLDLNNATRLDAALYYASLGWLVVPLHHPKDGRCSCGNPECGKNTGKHPRTSHGLKDASRDPEQIRRWWRQWPEANIGVVTGPESGIFVLDVDGDEGERSLAALIKRHGRPADTAKARTGGGGRHIVFRYPTTGQQVKNSTSKLGPKLDIRGDGGYIVAPPSLHASGRRYEWLISPAVTPPAEAPGWLLSLIAQEPPKTTTPREEPVDAVIEGGRNNHLTSLAGSMRRRGMSYEAILAALRAENQRVCRPPLPDSEVEKIAASVARYEPDLEEIPIEQQIQALPEQLNFEIHMTAWRRLIATVARKSPVQQEQYIRIIANRFKVNKGTIRQEIKAAEAEQKLAPPTPTPLPEPRTVDWSLAQDMRNNVFHYGIWLPTDKGEFVFHVVRSDHRIEEISDVPADRLPKDAARWSVDNKTPYNVFAYLAESIEDDPKALFTDLRTFFQRFMWYADDRIYDLLALWTMETYTFMVFDQIGYLALVGTKRAGKTRLFELLEMLCFNAILSTSVTDSYIFRSVEIDRATLLVDEADQLKAPAKEGVNERLEILRSGYRRSGRVGRIEGEDRRRVEFSTYSMKAIANVSGLEDALEDRTIAIPVERKPKHVKLEKVVHRRLRSEAQILRNRLYCFGLTWAAELARIYDEIEVEGVDDREAEIWAGIITLARVAAPDRIEGLLALAQANSAKKELHEGVESVEAQEILAVWQLVTEESPDVFPCWFKASRIQEAIREQLNWDSFSYQRLAVDLVKLRIIDDSPEFKQRFRLTEEILDKKGNIRRKTSQAMCYKLEYTRVAASAQRFGVSLTSETAEDDDESPY